MLDDLESPHLSNTPEKPSVVIGTVSVPMRHLLSICCIQHALLGEYESKVGASRREKVEHGDVLVCERDSVPTSRRDCLRKRQPFKFG